MRRRPLLLAALARAGGLAPAPRGGAAALRLPARPRRAPETAHRVVVRHRLARPDRDPAPGLSGHLLSQPHRPGGRPAQPLRAAPAAVRPCRADRSGGPATPPRPAHRALVGRRRRGRRRGPRWTAPTCRSAAGGCATKARTTRPGSTTRPSRWTCAWRAASRCCCRATQGYSRKGPDPGQASHYVTEPQLGVTGQIRIAGRSTDVQGRAWLDHEWSDQLLHPDAVGWDWIGINLADGSALTAFRLRRADGSALWAGGSWRAPGQAVRIFDADAVRFRPGRGLDQRGDRGPLPGAVAGRDAGRDLRRRRTDRRAGTRQPRQHRHGLLGRAVVR